MEGFEEGKLLRIFVSENDRYEKMALYEWIIRRARETHMAGATVLRGMEGFGAHSRMHTARILCLSSELPIVIEIIDTSERIDSFLQEIEYAVTEGLVTLEKVQVRSPRPEEKK